MLFRSGTSLLPLDVGYLFLVGSNILLLMVVQQQVAVLEFSEKMSARPSTPLSWVLFLYHQLVWNNQTVLVFHNLYSFKMVRYFVEGSV